MIWTGSIHIHILPLNHSRFIITTIHHGQVGTYNPIANRDGIKEIRLKSDRLKYWISVGAQPSDRVQWILGKFGILPPPPPRYSPKNMIPRKDRVDVKKK